MHLRHFALTSVVSHLTVAPPPPSTEDSNVNSIVQLVTIILIIVLATIFVICSLFFCCNRSLTSGCCGVNDGEEHDHHHHNGDGRRRRTPGLGQAVIETFPTYMYSDVRVHRLGNGELVCAVCLNEFKDVEILRMLPTCCHVFHPNCIDTWLLSQATCPVCRADVGSISNLAEHGDFRSMFGITSTDDDHSVDIEQQSVVQITTPEPITQITRYRENYPKSHSTGHSPGWTAHETDRFTLRLPDEVRNKLATSGCRWRSGGVMMGFMSSPRSWYRQRSVAGWFRSNDQNKKHNYHQFNTGNMVDRPQEPVASSNVAVSFSGSPKSDGQVDYSTLTNAQL